MHFCYYFGAKYKRSVEVIFNPVPINRTTDMNLVEAMTAYYARRMARDLQIAAPARKAPGEIRSILLDAGYPVGAVDAAMTRACAQIYGPPQD